MPSIAGEDAAWLASDEGERVLADLAGVTATPAVVARLRKGLPPARVAAALEVAVARRRGAAKFPQAERMLFTRRGVEQATDHWIAAYKASRFRGLGRVADVGCGVGGDLIGLTGVVAAPHGYERDRTLGRFAEHNLAVVGAGDATSAIVSPREAGADDLAECAAWHADPDRRPAGRRTTRPEWHEPSLDTLAAWRSVCGEAAIKLAPAARLPDAWREACELEWISRGGECRQLVAWCGGLARRPGEHAATRVFGGPADSASRRVVTLVGKPGPPEAAARPIGGWLFEPDPAVLAAGLTGGLAAKHGVAPFTTKAAYWTGDRPIDEPLLATFRVLDVQALDRRRLADWLAARGVGRLEIKCRGVDITPEKLRRELRPRGREAMTLLIAPPPDGSPSRKPIVIAAERVPSTGC